MREYLVEIAGKLGVPVEELTQTAVLVLPENLAIAESMEELYDADDSVLLVKQLRSRDIPCKTAYDLGLRPKVMDRRGADVWLGLIWLFLENAAFPVAVNVISEWITARIFPKRAKDTEDSASRLDEAATVHVELRVQRRRRTTTLRFDGPGDHFQKVLAALKELMDSRG